MAGLRVIHGQLFSNPSTFSSSCKVMPMTLDYRPLKFNIDPQSVSRSFGRFNRPLLIHGIPRSRLLCKMKDSGNETKNTRELGRNMTSQLELGKLGEKRKPEKRVNGIFWILLLNIGVYVADHIFQATFSTRQAKDPTRLLICWATGKLVEEEEGNFGLWLSYILTGAGANLVSWLILPRNAVSVGASGAVFGLFAISVLVKLSFDWRKILEVLILGQFVIERVMEAAQASTSFANSSNALQNVNHIAHLSGALVGATLVWLLSRVPSQSVDQDK
ncbi:Peptidase S54, rhomboid [Cynara cardunculus var. scolymus]|uniref:Peptidase S54, rhomboid n=1 Tax=Cynara cardunculus var. scolymus TaxID=59895 RepID=A0A118JT09_CYNCS|nr:Peptidase S54, rhomboid [Cynara cardunculus var. scolymus]